MKLPNIATNVVVVVAQSLVIVVELNVPASIKSQENGGRWGVLPEDPEAQFRWVGWTVEQMGGVMGALPTFGTAVGIFFWIYAGKVGFQVGAVP